MSQAAAYIFDFDGVVADSMPYHVLAWEKTHQKIFGKPLENPNRLRGLSTRQIATIFRNENTHVPEDGDIIGIKQDFLISFSDQISLFPGTAKIFLNLFEKKIPFAICSNAPSPYIKKVLASNQLKCPIIVGLGETKKAKPYPDPYIKAFELVRDSFGLALDLDLQTVFIFEDSTHGLEAGLRAGMTGIGIYGDEENTSRNDLISKGALKTYETIERAFKDHSIC